MNYITVSSNVVTYATFVIKAGGSAIAKSKKAARAVAIAAYFELTKVIIIKELCFVKAG